MYKLKKLNEVSKQAKIEHGIAYGIEFLMSIISIGILIYYIAIGDPDKRILPTLGSVFVFLIPVVVELVLKKRFCLSAHIIFTIYVTIAVFVGCALNMHNKDNPYDEIAHFIFGYVSCIFFFYVLLSWKDYKRQSTTFNALAIFLLGMSIAPIWEIMEFTVDILLSQTSLGFTTPEFLEEAKAAGLSGIALNIHRLEWGVPVWDTITDMTLHFGGSLLFTLQYVLHKRIKTPLMLAYIEKDYVQNKANFYTFIDKDEVTCEEPTNDDNI